MNGKEQVGELLDLIDIDIDYGQLFQEENRMVSVQENCIFCNSSVFILIHKDQFMT